MFMCSFGPLCMADVFASDHDAGPFVVGSIWDRSQPPDAQQMPLLEGL